MAASLIIRSTAALLLGVAMTAPSAESLPDPTRPSAGAAVPAADGRTVLPAAKAGLQSVILSTQRRAAVINGVIVELGGSVGDAKLVEVHENRVVLMNAQGRRVMELFPGVRMHKREAGSPLAQPAAASGQQETQSKMNVSAPASSVPEGNEGAHK